LTQKSYRLITLAIVLLMVLFVGWFASEVFEGETMAFDIAVRDQIHSHAFPALTKAMIGLSIIGSPLVVLLTLAVACLVLTYKKLWVEAMLLAGTGTVEMVLNTALKLTYLRRRPDFIFRLSSTGIVQLSQRACVWIFLRIRFAGYYRELPGDLALKGLDCQAHVGVANSPNWSFTCPPRSSLSNGRSGWISAGRNRCHTRRFLTRLFSSKYANRVIKTFFFQSSLPAHRDKIRLGNRDYNCLRENRLPNPAH
jgi:hypothetical protein